MPKPPKPFFKVDPETGCWLWARGRSSNGYGSHRHGGAHRWMWEQLRGPIPEGLQIDHLCRVRHCVNPDHLEPVTPAVNVQRGLAGDLRPPRTHCLRGHAMTPDNTYKGRDFTGCKKCRSAERHRGWIRFKARMAAEPEPPPPPKGVPLYREIDVLTLRMIQQGNIVVDIQSGEIRHPDGRRAELLNRTSGYGRVTVQSTPQRLALAHRVVYIAAHGLLTPETLVSHINGVRWDNRLENLSSSIGKVRVGRLMAWSDPCADTITAPSAAGSSKQDGPA